MSLKLLIDMNLSPRWVQVFEQYGWQAVHWSSIGEPEALDQDIMHWAFENTYVVFTHDLDFGTLLALTRAAGPSVIQARTQDVSPEHLRPMLASVLRDHESLIEAGALVVIDEATARVRALPLNR